MASAWTPGRLRHHGTGSDRPGSRPTGARPASGSATRASAEPCSCSCTCTCTGHARRPYGAYPRNGPVELSRDHSAPGLRLTLSPPLVHHPADNQAEKPGNRRGLWFLTRCLSIEHARVSTALRRAPASRPIWRMGGPGFITSMLLVLVHRPGARNHLRRKRAAAELGQRRKKPEYTRLHIKRVAARLSVSFVF